MVMIIIHYKIVAFFELGSNKAYTGLYKVYIVRLLEMRVCFLLSLFN